MAARLLPLLLLVTSHALAKKGGCADDSDLCFFWMASGDCDMEKEWMEEFCPATCGFCVQEKAVEVLEEKNQTRTFPTRFVGAGRHASATAPGTSLPAAGQFLTEDKANYVPTSPVDPVVPTSAYVIYKEKSNEKTDVANTSQWKMATDFDAYHPKTKIVTSESESKSPEAYSSSSTKEVVSILEAPSKPIEIQPKLVVGEGRLPVTVSSQEVQVQLFLPTPAPVSNRRRKEESMEQHVGGSSSGISVLDKNYEVQEDIYNPKTKLVTEKDSKNADKLPSHRQTPYVLGPSEEIKKGNKARVLFQIPTFDKEDKPRFDNAAVQRPESVWLRQANHLGSANINELPVDAFTARPTPFVKLPENLKPAKSVQERIEVSREKTTELTEGYVGQEAFGEVPNPQSQIGLQPRRLIEQQVVQPPQPVLIVPESVNTPIIVEAPQSPYLNARAPDHSQTFVSSTGSHQLFPGDTKPKNDEKIFADHQITIANHQTAFNSALKPGPQVYPTQPRRPLVPSPFNPQPHVAAQPRIIVPQAHTTGYQPQPQLAQPQPVQPQHQFLWPSQTQFRPWPSTTIAPPTRHPTLIPKDAAAHTIYRRPPSRVSAEQFIAYAEWEPWSEWSGCSLGKQYRHRECAVHETPRFYCHGSKLSHRLCLNELRI